MSRRSSRRRGQQQRGSGAAVTGDIIDPQTGRAIRLIRGGEQIQLGDLDEHDGENEAVTATFRLRHPGEGVKTYRVNPNLTELVVVDLLEEADSVEKTDPRAMTITKKYAFEHVHPDDREAFWRTVMAKRMDSAELMVLCWKILEGITANPTGGQSDSSAGQPVTRLSSVPDLSTPVAVPSDPQSARRAAFLAHIDRIQSRTDDEGKLLPINAAVAAQLVVTARAQGIELDPSRSQAATG